MSELKLENTDSTYSLIVEELTSSNYTYLRFYYYKVIVGCMKINKEQAKQIIEHLQQQFGL